MKLSEKTLSNIRITSYFLFVYLFAGYYYNFQAATIGILIAIPIIFLVSYIIAKILGSK